MSDAGAHSIQLGSHSWLFNPIDPMVVCDHYIEVASAMAAAVTGLAGGSSPMVGSAAAYAALAHTLPPERIAFHRGHVLACAMVDNVPALKAIKDRKISPGDAMAGFMEGLIWNYAPFSGGAGQLLGRVVEGASSASTTSPQSGQSGGSSSSG